MRRGEIYYAHLGRTVGSEINKRRAGPHRQQRCQQSRCVTVLPITSNISRVYPFELLIDPKESGLPKPSKVQAQQIRTIAKKRITGAHLGRLTLETLKRVQGAIRLHLALA
jgi:mRNA interferase MazF